MSLIEALKGILVSSGEGLPPSPAELALQLEQQRRYTAWEVFKEYHHNAMWAREDAERKQVDNTYLAPEAVEYMQGEIKRRAGREALRLAMEEEEKKILEKQHAEGKYANAGAIAGGQSQAETMESCITQRAPSGDFGLAAEFQQAGRRHEGQPAADAPAQAQDSTVDGTTDGVGGKDQGPQEPHE